ncbi:MAG: hypothetical protein CL674_01140 [Bdellovibrionaceae bacterium]|nr:hypothetical protein [Pseudobdellovibrionaceae bacterium]
MTMEKIESAKNKKFQYWNSLREAKSLKKADHFIVSGLSWVNENLSKHKDLVDCLICVSESQAIQYPEQKVFILEKSLFHELDEFGTKSPLLIMKKKNIPEFKEDILKQDGIHLFLPLGDPSNLGAVLRSAAAFDVKNIILLKEACSVFHPKCVRSSAGNLLDLKLYQGPSIEDLSAEDFYILDAGGKNLSDLKLENKSIKLLLGEEGPGVPQKFRSSKNCVRIPISDSVESLNAGVAASIAIYEINKKL